MVIIDYILLGALAVSVVIGFFRGFFREAMSLVNWAVAAWLAWRFSPLVEPFLDAISSPSLQLWLSRLIVFVLALLAGALLSHLVVMLVRKTGLNGTDRVLGMLFGAARGVLVIGILVIGFQMLEMDREPWWQDSWVVPRTASLTGHLREFIDAGLDRLGDLMAE